MGLHKIHLQSIPMNLFISLLLISMATYWPMSSDAEDFNLNSLKSKRDSLNVIYKSLSESRLGLVGARDSLSVFIDSLKRINSRHTDLRNNISRVWSWLRNFGRKPYGTTELDDALLKLMSLLAPLVEIDQQIEQVGINRNGIQERLRLAYDWEISRLYKMLSENQDRGLLMQWMILRKERQKLGDSVIEPMRMQFPIEMTIVGTDGPAQIRQKIEVLEGKAGLLHKKRQQLEDRVGRLEHQGRLERQMWVWVREYKLEEFVPRGESFHSESVKSGKPNPSLNSSNNGQISSEARRTTKLRRRVEIRRGKRLMPVPASPRDYVLELHKLRVRQQELREMEAVVNERVDTFHLHLQNLLDGPE
tara:strand:- start:2576 stop:3661 length:1086 start_codon:yes stop_codon:yes gene_type:complete